MEFNHDSVLPNNLDEAIEILKVFYKNELDFIKQLSEKEFRSSSHFGAGMFIRNQWHLWWIEGRKYPSDWPTTKPKLIEFFNNKGIEHPDDMSSIILTSMYRSICGVDINLEDQIKFYIDFYNRNK